MVPVSIQLVEVRFHSIKKTNRIDDGICPVLGTLPYSNRDSVLPNKNHISLLITMVEVGVVIAWVVFLIIIALTLIKGVKVVHQGTFMIVEHFGEYSVCFFHVYVIASREL